MHISGQGVAAGMFYRFLVADDTSVDRYIIRDVDSRLNARDRSNWLSIMLAGSSVCLILLLFVMVRLAVEEWIQSKKSIHILRDHINHCNTINGTWLVPSF
jgi:hypothetical protein